MNFHLVKSDSDYDAIVSHMFYNTNCFRLLVYILFLKNIVFLDKCPPMIIKLVLCFTTQNSEIGNPTNTQSSELF